MLRMPATFTALPAVTHTPSEGKTAMPLHYANLRNHTFPERTQAYTEKDVMLYALGLGFGADPMDMKQLRFVYEKSLQVLPTMPVVM